SVSHSIGSFPRVGTSGSAPASSAARTSSTTCPSKASRSRCGAVVMPIPRLRNSCGNGRVYPRPPGEWSPVGQSWFSQPSELAAGANPEFGPLERLGPRPPADQPTGRSGIGRKLRGHPPLPAAAGEERREQDGDDRQQDHDRPDLGKRNTKKR